MNVSKSSSRLYLLQLYIAEIMSLITIKKISSPCLKSFPKTRLSTISPFEVSMLSSLTFVTWLLRIKKSPLKIFLDRLSAVSKSLKATKAKVHPKIEIIILEENPNQINKHVKNVRKYITVLF